MSWSSHIGSSRSARLGRIDFQWRASARRRAAREAAQLAARKAVAPASQPSAAIKLPAVAATAPAGNQPRKVTP